MKNLTSKGYLSPIQLPWGGEIPIFIPHLAYSLQLLLDLLQDVLYVLFVIFKQEYFFGKLLAEGGGEVQP